MSRSTLTIFLGAAVILATVGAAYSPVLQGAPGLAPWGSDALGHVLKAIYLSRGLAAGNLYPDLFPDWYLGIQMLRYYPPLPYYLLAALAALVGDPVRAASWLVVLCAAGGGLAWLGLRRWTGLWPAVVGGCLFAILPDHMRVTFAEGNLPRAVATALSPLMLAALLAIVAPGEAERPSRRAIAGLAALMALTVLSHAMMAAIEAVVIGGTAALAAITGATSARRTAIVIGSLALGLCLGGAWLLPSLSGGITEINVAAMTEALATVSLAQHADLLARLHDPEAVYVGVALLALAAAGLGVRTGRTRLTVALTLAGLAGVVVATPAGSAAFALLPLHQLLWPLRFLGIASTLLLLAVALRLRAAPRSVALLVVGALAADSALSLGLAHLRRERPEVAAVSRALADTPGWRVATLDLSRLGSGPTYAFSTTGGREQVFGWAYQGARAAATVAALNEAFERNATAYILDRLDMYGVDDVVLLNNLPSARDTAAELAGAGWRPAYAGDELTLYHRDGGPRAVVAAWPALGIGRNIPALAARFPQVVAATSPLVDDYTLDDLRAYRVVVLAGFGWHDKAAAEDLVRQAAAAGVRIVVDLTGAPEDPWARAPQFLGVWGEPIVLGDQPVRLLGGADPIDLLPFATGRTWHTYTPQGLDSVTLTFDYMGETAAAVGRRRAGGDIAFVGLNLIEHIRLANDPAALALLAGTLGIPADTPNRYQTVALDGYRAGPDGTSFTYALGTPARLIVPIARHDGAQVAIDGASVAVGSLERLVAFDAPAGRHTVTVTYRPPAIYPAGTALSIAAAGLLIAWTLPRRRVPSLAGASSPCASPTDSSRSPS